MARVVVTGANGFVGSHLMEELQRRGDEVVAYDCRRSSGGTDARQIEGDVRDVARLGTAITPGVDIVYHLAAVVGVDRYLERPIDVIDINVQGTKNVLELADRAGAKVVVVSTSEVFGKNPAVPWSENADRVLGSTSLDRWSYSSSKAAAEHLTYAFIRQRSLPATIVRYFNLYGPRQRPAFVVSRSIHRALRGVPPVVYDDGGQTRSFTYISDVMSATVAAGTNPKADGESFNLGSTEETSIHDLVGLVCELTGVRQPATEIDISARYGDRYQDLLRRLPDTTKAYDILGWTCATTLRDGLARTVEWARQQPEWLAEGDSGAG